MDINTFKTIEQYSEDKYIKQIRKLQGHTTNEDYEKVCKKLEAFRSNNYEVFGDYYEDLIYSYKEVVDLEIHQTMVLVDKNTGEIVSSDFHIIDIDYIEKKRKEFNSLKYYKNKLTKSKQQSKIKIENFKSNHRYTKVFSKVRPLFSNHKNIGIFYDLARELSPYENIVSKQNNDGTFTPMTTKEIQEKFNISVDDMKRFKVEAKKLKVIADVKLEGKAVGIRINPIYALNGQDLSEDLVEAFKDTYELSND
ncbi:hypothetical protein [Aliarcobacter cryaerophilus]|uniref:hypothetical protein n=1 Tax=Aliarcobacter cryaerophilus TaxID=28198 RepID=UPI0016540075|nr:hypothetical protein [Aliarcobacter cryaerophilus]QNM87319.1 hypothetical protein HOO41_06075 [Aliarcobacter cryaerophilus]